MNSKNSKFQLPKNEIMEALLAFKGTFRTVGVFSAIINLLMLVPSIYMLQVYDRVLASRNEITLLMLTVMMLGAFVFMGALELIRSFVLVRVGANFDMHALPKSSALHCENACWPKAIINKSIGMIFFIVSIF